MVSSPKNSTMKEETTKQLLRNPEQEPTEELFKSVLDESIYNILKKIDQSFLNAGIDLEWRYYKDGKAWLGKATFKKKTMVWISAWEGFIKASFYFTEKTRSGVLDLSISEEVKSSFANANPIGKLIPLTFDIKDKEQLQDFNTLLNYKKILR